MFCWYFEDISIAIETSRRSNGLSCVLCVSALFAFYSRRSKSYRRGRRDAEDTEKDFEFL